MVGKSIRSVCYHICSLVCVVSPRSFVLNYEAQNSENKKSPKPTTKYSKKSKENRKTADSSKGVSEGKKRGRPKGSKDKTQTKEYTALSKSFEILLKAALTLLATIGIVPVYVVADDAYGAKTLS